MGFYDPAGWMRTVEDPGEMDPGIAYKATRTVFAYANDADEAALFIQMLGLEDFVGKPELVS